MTIDNYINNLSQRYKLGNATEHTFRGDLQQLLETLVPSIRATNEPKRQSCGAPDYILTKKDIPVGFIEAKDIGDKDLDGKKKTGNKEQFDRYKASLDNLIFTDYINFHLYREGEFVTSIAIAEITENGIKALPENFANFDNLIKDFCVHIGQTIKSPKRLAEMMAGKARLLSDIIEKSLTSDEENRENSTLKEQMLAFKEILIHDITPQGFADVYAQTIAYGMFAARLHDPTLDNFSRQEAAELIPKSNPFLRKLFGYIAGPDIDDRIKWVVENLAEIFLACNVSEILKNYGKATKMEDPIIHFYETFLSEYDPKLRKARGVWYTPQPVVNFIVRAVDDILKTEFDLPQGLTDTSKTEIKVDIQGKKVKQEVHKVQILDPATGTGTFLAETIKHIHKRFEGQQGIWSNYVETHLLPRLNGFELLMASYAMAHLKLDLLLTETGYRTTPPVRHPSKGGEQRLRVYLTNSLEEHHQDTGTLFANWLSTEANEANHIKRDTPVMCVIGNPPYSGESANKGEWIMSLMDDYKKEPGGKDKLKERNSKSINDDYVKFLRFGQYFIEKNGSGVLAFINPHGLLDNTTYRGIRWNLLKTYDKIYTIDLHGNAKNKEQTSDSIPDQNVFDIMQGVSINIFIKTDSKQKNKLGKILHHEIYGSRLVKYNILQNKSLKDIDFNEVKAKQPNYFFVNKNIDSLEAYQEGFSLENLYLIHSSGIAGGLDKICIHFYKHQCEEQLRIIKNNSLKDLTSIYYPNISENKIRQAKLDIDENLASVEKILYRVLDLRFVLYTGKSNGIMGRPRSAVMQHFVQKENIGIILNKQHVNESYSHCSVTRCISNKGTHYLGNKGNDNLFPLYLYPVTSGQQSLEKTEERKPNLKAEIVHQIAEKLGLTFTNEKDTSTALSVTPTTFAPIDILDYIYAVLHSPTYRSTYKEFLKIDFPRVPYPKDQDTFWQLVKLGGEIRQIHLLESPKVEQYITQYPMDGDNEVTRKITKSSPGYVPDNDTQGKVWINDEQYFDNVPQVAWEFYIGGYQPAQKWLKDRKGRQLEFDDILHYQKIIVALSETDRLMKEIDEIEII